MPTEPHRRFQPTALGLVAGLGAMLGSCSATGVLNAMEPADGVAQTRDVAFRPGPRGGLDVYQPARPATPAPVVVFFYGGGWDDGRRQDYRFVGRALARQGFLTLIPDYRIYPEVGFPSFLQDSAEAVRWARDHAGAYGGDPTRLFLIGHSAGAYNAMMLALDRRWLGAVGLDPRRDLQGVVGIAGPYDFLPLQSERLKIIFGPPETRPATQPIAYVDGRQPPLFLAVDAGDKVVDPGNTTRLADRVRAMGGSVEVKGYKGLSHALLLGAFATPLRFMAPVLADASAFIASRAGAAP